MYIFIYNYLYVYHGIVPHVPPYVFVICCNVLTGGQLVDVSQETGLVLFPSVVASFPAPVDGRNPIR